MIEGEKKKRKKKKKKGVNVTSERDAHRKWEISPAKNIAKKRKKDEGGEMEHGCKK
jgi:hypothetical protein